MDLRFTSKIKRKTIDDQWELILIDRQKVVAKVGEVLGKIDEVEKDITVIFKESDLKTREELGYFHAEVLPKLRIAYELIGYPVFNEFAAKCQLKKDFGYYESYQVVDRATGEIITEYAQKSFSKAGKKEMAKIIDFAIMICLEAGVEVHTPEDYKSRR